jgi:PKD repeat protein
VSLTASGPGGSDTLTRTNYITVSSGVYTTTHRVISYTYPSTLLRTGDSLYRLITATYSSGEFYHYTYPSTVPSLRSGLRLRTGDAVGNRQSLTTHVGVVNYQYDDANRLTSVNGQTYNWDDNGNPSTGSGQACSRTACAPTATTTPTASPRS